jgi:predicted nucleic acid-binding protein
MFAHSELSALGLSYVENVSLEEVSRIHDIANRRKLSFYDAVYLSLALERSALLATKDDNLRKAARAEGLEVFE